MKKNRYKPIKFAKEARDLSFKHNLAVYSLLNPYFDHKSGGLAESYEFYKSLGNEFTGKSKSHPMKIGNTTALHEFKRFENGISTSELRPTKQDIQALKKAINGKSAWGIIRQQWGEGIGQKLFTWGEFFITYPFVPSKFVKEVYNEAIKQRSRLNADNLILTP